MNADHGNAEATTRTTDDSLSGSSASKWLAASVPVAAALFAVGGISSGDIGRVARIHPFLYVPGILALLAAVICGVLGVTRLAGRTVTFLGAVLFVVGVSILVGAHALATGQQERPTVQVGLNNEGSGLEARVRVKAAGMKPNEYIFFAIQGLNSSKHLDPQSAAFDENNHARIPSGEYSKQRVYSGRIGADPDGTVDSNFKVALASDLYELVFVQAAIVQADETSRHEEAQLMTEGDSRRVVCSPATTNVSCMTILLPSPLD